MFINIPIYTGTAILLVLFLWRTVTDTPGLIPSFDSKETIGQWGDVTLPRSHFELVARSWVSRPTGLGSFLFPQ